MKKLLSFILLITMGITLISCSGTKKAFEISKSAYDSIGIAYTITDQFASDIYEAWRMGIFDDEEILNDGAHYLATELSLSEDEVRDGIAYTVNEIMGSESWDDLSDTDKQNYRNQSDLYFTIFEDDLFTFCVMIVTGAYQANGKIAEAQTALDSAKELMKELSDKYSDYEHYPNLKGYYTTTSSFFEFCQSPTGSFEQIKTTINDYKNEARDYISDLNYIFEE